jgi:hypothetical protein
MSVNLRASKERLKEFYDEAKRRPEEDAQGD